MENRLQDIASHPDRRMEERKMMVDTTIKRRDINDPDLIHAFLKVPREAFVPEELERYAYEDRPLKIGEGQTISQPYIVALMASMADIKKGDRVLEVGSGSGYAAAVFSHIADTVYGVERHLALAEGARECLAALGYQDVQFFHGDGARGLPDHAPFDVIIVSAGGPKVPEALMEQLSIGGRLIIPVGEDMRLQRLVRVTRVSQEKFEKEDLDAVRFVPLIGSDAWAETEVD